MRLDNLLYSSRPIHHDARFQVFLDRQMHFFLYEVYFARAYDAFPDARGLIFPLFDFRRSCRSMRLDGTAIEELLLAFDALQIAQLNPYVPLRMAFETGVDFRLEGSVSIVVDQQYRFEGSRVPLEKIDKIPRDLPDADDWWACLRPHNH